MTTKLERRPYTYRPLDLKSSEIRLIRLLPYLTEDGLLQCEILHRNLDDTDQALYLDREMTWEQFWAWDVEREIGRQRDFERNAAIRVTRTEHNGDDIAYNAEDVRTDTDDTEHDTEEHVGTNAGSAECGIDDVEHHMNDSSYDMDHKEHDARRLQYAALSYVWGPPEPKHERVIDNCSLSIRTNLWRFLHKIRNMIHEDWTPGTELLWVDQICINQIDCGT